VTPADPLSAGATKIAVFRPSTAEWFLRETGGGTTRRQYGAPGDLPIPADYDGVAGDDIAVFRPSQRNSETALWFIRFEYPDPNQYDPNNPAGPPLARFFGHTGDLPAPADYVGTAGNNSDELAVFRPRTGELFYFSPGAQRDGRLVNSVRVPIGGPGAIPVPADFLAEGEDQVAVFDPGRPAIPFRFPGSPPTWRILGDDGLVGFQFGGLGDQPVPADYLEEGRAQIAVYRPSTAEWFIRPWFPNLQPANPVRVQFGAPGDIPVPGDYLGLGRAQIAVYRPSTQQWFIRRDNGSAEVVQFGGPGDIPVPARYPPGFGG
jgi:hypothetical protein